MKAYGGRALIGAGTVLKPEQVDQLAGMGCKLVVTPNIQPEVIRRAVSYGMTVCPGCATAAEAFAALDAGAQALKIFPSSAFGPGYISALKAVLPPDVPLFAVGGVTPENPRNGLKPAVWARDWVAISIAPGNPLNAPRSRLRHLLMRIERQ